MNAKKIQFTKRIIISLILICICIGIVKTNIDIKNKFLIKEIVDNKSFSSELNDSYENIIAVVAKEEALLKARLEAERKAKEEAKAKKEAEARQKKEAEERAEKEQTNTKLAPTIPKSELQAYAHDLVINSYGWTEEDFSALVNLWNKESGWNPNATNKKSKAHGIPQALPASKMASEGADYYTNGKTQIRWGLKYIKSRYKTPTKAWEHFQNKHWY